MSEDQKMEPRPKGDDPDRSPRISVVVAVYNRSFELRRLLVALGRQSFALDRFEVVVCDDGSFEDIRRVAGEAAEESGLRAFYLRQPNRGCGAARNLGLAHARGEVVAFTDSDCIPEPNWLDAVDRAFRDEKLGVAGGPIDFLGARHLSGRCVNFLMSSTLGAGGSRDPRSLIRVSYCPRGGNYAVRREWALDAGGFSESTPGEDLVLTRRLAERGAGVAFVPDAVVLHDERSGSAEIFAESFRKGAARVRLRRVFGLHEAFHAIPAAVVFSLAASVVLSFRPETRSIGVAPPVAYGAMLMVLAVQGAVALREARALAAVPWYASLLHVGYGLGYLAATFGVAGRRDFGRPTSWDELRALETPIPCGQSANRSPDRGTADTVSVGGSSGDARR